VNNNQQYSAHDVLRETFLPLTDRLAPNQRRHQTSVREVSLSENNSFPDIDISMLLQVKLASQDIRGPAHFIYSRKCWHS
jgi:hypothetical protein